MEELADVVAKMKTCEAELAEYHAEHTCANCGCRIGPGTNMSLFQTEDGTNYCGECIETVKAAAEKKRLSDGYAQRGLEDRTKPVGGPEYAKPAPSDQHNKYSAGNRPPYRWIITADYITPEAGRTAVGTQGPGGLNPRLTLMPTQFRLKDDDGVLYYEGIIFGEYDGFEPLDDFGRGHAGCTTIEYLTDSASPRWEVI